jgi:serine/threonine protein kinase
MTVPPVGIGELIAGKYVVERVIGEGGMGVVVAARHLELDQRVAIKCLLSEIAEQGMAAERFRREARAAAKMRGEHVCRVLDVGTLENGVPFMVMEYLEGWDLASELDRRGSLPAEEAVGYVLEACEALAEAHTNGIVHRDLKPANLFLESRADGTRRVKVLDFGVSKSLLDVGAAGQGALTKTSSLVGSPLYMSPEQLDSARDVDGRADVWALGIVLHELIAGATPFTGDTIPQLVAAVLHDQPIALSSVRPDVSRELDAIVMRALEKRRAERFSTVGELAEALLPFGPIGATGTVRRVARLLDPSGMHKTQRAGSGSSPRPVAAPSSATAATPMSWGTQAKRQQAKRLWGVLGVLLALGCVFGLWRFRMSDAEHERAASPAAAAAGNTITPSAVSAPAPDPTPAIVPSLPPVSPVTSNDKPVDSAVENEADVAKIKLTAPLEKEHKSALRPSAPAERAEHNGTQAPPVPRPTSNLSDFGGRR